jgi:hypothetical protein
VTFDPARLYSLDLETHQIEVGILAPRIVCGSTPERLIYEPNDPPRAVVGAFTDPIRSDVILTGANIAYDFGCLAVADPGLLPAIFRAYEERRVFDVQIAQALHAIAEGNLFLDPVTGRELDGRYNLERLVSLVLGRDDAKIHDTWRRRYALLDGVPLEDWPREARVYPVDDARNTLEVAIAQIRGGGTGVTSGPHRNLGDLADQAETAFAMHLGAIWGMRADRERIAELKARTLEAHAAFVKKFRALGFYDGDKANTHAVKLAVARAYGADQPCPACVGGKLLSPISGRPINCKTCSGTGLDVSMCPKTKTGGLCADRDSKMNSGDPDLVALGANEPEKILSTYLPALEAEKIGRFLRPNVLVASGRTSYDGLVQLVGKDMGVRECHRARDGYVLCSVDFSALELCTLSQVELNMFGSSIMADTINATGDPGALHTAFAARLAGKSTEEMRVAIKSPDAVLKKWAKKYRDAAKAGNFGFPGGMGPAKFVYSKRRKNEGETIAPDGTKYPGIRFCILLAGAERCGTSRVWAGTNPPQLVCEKCFAIVRDELRPAWLEQWRMQRYLTRISNIVGKEGRGELRCWGTERVRGGLDYTNGANNGFQALAADGAKYALRCLTRECYLDRSSVLYGSRPIVFIHDEIIAEIPLEVAHLAGPRMAKVMVDGMRKFVPDVTIVAEPALGFYWDKRMEPVYRDGKLVPWEPEGVR